MGRVIALLLVRWRTLILSLSLLICACGQGREQVGSNRVDATRYDTFWLWAGVKSQAVLDSAKEIYILDAEITVGPSDKQFALLRPAVPSVKATPVWLVVRLETLALSEADYAAIAGRISRWQRAGNNLRGLQIDFDARTKGLSGYALFLKDLRRRLPKELNLSVTGLMDWSANGDPEALAAMDGVVDEIVIQTYQGRHTIAGYETYLRRLARLDMPYKIGLVQNGLWEEPKHIQSDPNFKGYVVFLLNTPKKER